METYKLKLTLLSDATFGRGDGVAGLVDVEVEHDAHGLPYLRGRALKGLLAEECANILFGLQKAGRWQEKAQKAAQSLFGQPGSNLEDGAGVHVGDAALPAPLRAAIAADLQADKPAYTPNDVLESLSAIRNQTAMDETGVPADGSLRAMRVILRGTVFEADLHFPSPSTKDALALLAACAKALRRVGGGRNRGRGRVQVTLCDVQGKDITAKHFDYFASEVSQ